MSIENRNKEQMYGELQAQRTTFEAVRAGLIGKEMGSPDTSSETRELMQLLEKTGLQIEVSALTPAVAEQLASYAEQAVALAEEHNITPAETEFAVQAAEQAAVEQLREGTGALYLFDRIKLPQPIAHFATMLAVMILLVSGCVMPDVAQAATETPDQATTLDIDDVEQNLNGTSTPTKVPPKKTPTPAKTPVPTKEAQPTPTATPEPLRWQRTLTVQVDSLNIRSDASTSSLSIGSLKKGDVIDEYTRVSKGLNEVWANIGPNQYVAISIDGTEFVLEESTLLNPGKSLGGNELSVQDRAGVVETIKKLDLRGFEDLTDIVPTSTGFDLEDSEGNDVGQIVIRTNGEVAIYQSRAKVAEANEDGLFVNLLSEYLDEIREQHPEVEISSEDAAAILAGEEPAVQITVGTAPNQSLRFFKDGVRWLVEGQEASPTVTPTATVEAESETTEVLTYQEMSQRFPELMQQVPPRLIDQEASITSNQVVFETINAQTLRYEFDGTLVTAYDQDGNEVMRSVVGNKDETLNGWAEPLFTGERFQIDLGTNYNNPDMDPNFTRAVTYKDDPVPYYVAIIGNSPQIIRNDANLAEWFINRTEYLGGYKERALISSITPETVLATNGGMVDRAVETFLKGLIDHQGNYDVPVEKDGNIAYATIDPQKKVRVIVDRFPGKDGYHSSKGSKITGLPDHFYDVSDDGELTIWVVDKGVSGSFVQDHLYMVLCEIWNRVGIASPPGFGAERNNLGIATHPEIMANSYQVYGEQGNIYVVAPLIGLQASDDQNGASLNVIP